MLNLNCTILSQVVDQAMQKAAAEPRWLKAIERAVVELLSNPYLHRQDDHGLLIASSSSDSIYSANGVCQCRAYAYGNPCWHRACARLVRLHDVAEAEAAQVAHLISLSGCSVADARQVINEFTGKVAPFVCGACCTGDYGPSAMQPAICTECVQAWLSGFADRFDRDQAIAAADRAARQAAAQAAMDEMYA